MDDASLTHKVESLCRALGYAGSGTYFTKAESFDRLENVHVVMTAFGAIGVHSVFGIADGAIPGSFKPVVYVGQARDDLAANELHRRVWTQGVVPLLILVTPGGVEVRNGFGPPSDGSVLTRHEDVDNVLPRSLEDVSARSLTTSIFWKDRKVSRSDTIDSRLVAAIEQLNRYACTTYPQLDTRQGRALVNALVGRLIYLFVLIDRGLIDEQWLRDVIRASGCKGMGFADAASHRGVRSNYPEFSTDEVWAALDGIDGAINGCVFPIAETERPLIPSELIQFIHRVVRWDEKVEGRQLSFLDVSFQVLRTETISAIYERFLRLEDGDAQRTEGAFYTPPYLADFVVARADAQLPMEATSRVVDAAAGSGVFLVSAYRRIMERCAPPGGWGAAHANSARRLLRDCIFGIEKNAQAANVCRFSLYMTMLDYISGVAIKDLAEIDAGEKLLPPLTDNIVVASAFSHPFEGRTFTHVLGNPPWLRLKRQGARRNTQAANQSAPANDDALTAFLAELPAETPVMHGRLSDAFVWLAVTRLCEKGAVIGLILPTTSLVGRQSERFATALASKVSVRSVANLSYLRYRLFTGARAPATVVVARHQAPQPSDLVSVYRPRLSSLPLGKVGDVWALFVSQTDLQTVQVRELQGDSNGWFGPLILGTVDRRTRDALRNVTRRRKATVEEFLKRSGLRIQRGGNEEDTGFRFPMRTDRRGREIPVNLVALPKVLDQEIAVGYRGLFSGNILLVPRAFKGLRVLEEPHAFNSTFYGIFFADQVGNASATNLSKLSRGDRQMDALLSLKAFLESGVVRYFAALYGATVLLDGARFEKGDLLSIPCPFEDASEPAFLDLHGSPDTDGSILDALGAGLDLRRAVKEFLSFSEGYADAQLPSDAFEEAGEDQIRVYLDRFSRDLAAAFTERFAPSVTIEGRGDGIVRLRVAFGQDAEKEGATPPNRDGKFVASSVVSFDAKSRVARLSKSSALFAWMADQAVDDACEVIRQVVSGCP